MNTTLTHALATESPVGFITGCSTGFGLARAADFPTSQASAQA